MVATLSCRQCQPHQKPTEVLMLQMVSRLLPEVPFFLVTALATHFVMSLGQTLMPNVPR
jgi:hypothetical protein